MSERRMGELPEGGNQILCEGISKLNYLVDAAMDNRGDLGEKGYGFAKESTMERFEKEWGRVLSF